MSILMPVIMINSNYDRYEFNERDLIRIYEIPNVGFGIVWLYIN